MSTQVCPECNGERIVGHQSFFTWNHAMSCSLLKAEDATASADHEWLIATNSASWFKREMTATERTLLAACGIVFEVDDESTLLTACTWQGGIRRRVFGIAGHPPITPDPPDSVLRGIRWVAPTL